MRRQVMTISIILSTTFLQGSVSLPAARPGWQAWQPLAPTPLPFTAGFSNSELGGYLDFEAECEARSQTANSPVNYWYRVSDLLAQIGSGQVEYGCEVGGTIAATINQRAVQRHLPSPLCLQVQSDAGNGLNVRAEPALTAPLQRVLPNGTQIELEDPLALVVSDTTGRQWLAVPSAGTTVWVSLAAQPGAHVNLRLCAR